MCCCTHIALYSVQMHCKQCRCTDIYAIIISHNFKSGVLCNKLTLDTYVTHTFTNICINNNHSYQSMKEKYNTINRQYTMYIIY